MKLLSGWLSTTRTLRSQRGMTILHHSSGDLKLVINELDIAVLTAEDGGQKVWDNIGATYQQYLEKKLPKAMERVLFSAEGRRQRQEMLQYVARKRMLLDELSRATCLLPSNA